MNGDLPPTRDRATPKLLLQLAAVSVAFVVAMHVFVRVFAV